METIFSLKKSTDRKQRILNKNFVKKFTVCATMDESERRVEQK